MGKSYEELYIVNIENGIRAIKLGLKNPNETQVNYFLNKLKEINIGLFDDYTRKYINIVKEYEKKKKK